MNIIKSAKISRFILKSVRDFNEFHTPRCRASTIMKVAVLVVLHLGVLVLHCVDASHVMFEGQLPSEVSSDFSSQVL